MISEDDQAGDHRSSGSPSRKRWARPTLTRHQVAAAEANLGNTGTDGVYTS